MRRNGFTMVELIFVIIIIGILSVAAIPKFGDIKDRAKINSEYSSLSGLDGAIIAAMEFQYEDNDNIFVDWHETAWRTNLNTTYGDVNTNDNVLKKIIQKGEDLDMVAYVDAGTAGANGVYDDVIFIEGKASNAENGVKQDGVTDTNGKPDKNDVWVFNASSEDITISGDDITDVNVSSGELTLIDAVDTLTYGTNINVYYEGNTTAHTINTL